MKHLFGIYKTGLFKALNLVSGTCEEAEEPNRKRVIKIFPHSYYISICHFHGKFRFRTVMFTLN